jgi:hypothetical protein
MLDRREEGRRCYEAALAANPTVEDPKLAVAFASKVRTFAVDGRMSAFDPKRTQCVAPITSVKALVNSNSDSRFLKRV